jgi:hypothetical protein
MLEEITLCRVQADLKGQHKELLQYFNDYWLHEHVHHQVICKIRRAAVRLPRSTS